MRLIALRVERDDAFHGLDRLGILLGLAVERAQKRVNFFAVVALFERRLQDINGFLGLLFAFIEIGGLDARIDKQLAFLGHALEGFQRFVVGS